MALQHDSATGFLRGESVADEIDKLVQELKLLRAIEANTSDIAKRLLSLGLTGTPVQPDSAGVNGDVALPVARNDSLFPLSPGAGVDRAPATPIISISPVVPRQAGTTEPTKPPANSPGEIDRISSPVSSTHTVENNLVHQGGQGSAGEPRAVNATSGQPPAQSQPISRPAAAEPASELRVINVTAQSPAKTQPDRNLTVAQPARSGAQG